MLQEGHLRPDWITIDDPETEDTIRSETETLVRKARIENEISFLGGDGAPCVYLLLATVRTVVCLAAQYTDPAQQPSWNGKRYPAMIEAPARQDLWEKYQALCRLTGLGDDEEQRKLEESEPLDVPVIVGMEPAEYAEQTIGYRHALYFYAKHKAEMDAGAKMLDATRRPVHDFYYILAVKGEAVVASELQQNPKSDPNVEDRKLEAPQILLRCTDSPPGLVPAWGAFVLCTVDVGEYRLHWEANAWTQDYSTPLMLDCGIQDTNVNKDGQMTATNISSQRWTMVEEGIRYGLSQLDARFSRGWPLAAGNGVMLPVFCGVDCGGTAEGRAWMEVILNFCRERPDRWVPMKGEEWKDSIAERAQGRHWICEPRDNPARRVDCDADHYKNAVYRGYQAPAFSAPDQKTPNAGARLLHRDDPLHGHGLSEYARHQTSEKFTSQFLPGRKIDKAERIGWYPRTSTARKYNHWWDTAWMQYALADVSKFIAIRADSQQKPVQQTQSTHGPQLPAWVQRERF